MDKIDFEWDAEKTKLNTKKHGITFEEASTVFFDELAIVFDDPEHSQDEERLLILGLSEKTNMLIVCHCARENDKKIRIISARKATKNETKQHTDINKEW